MLTNIVNRYVVIASTVDGESIVTVTYVLGRVAAVSIAITRPVSESIPYKFPSNVDTPKPV